MATRPASEIASLSLRKGVDIYDLSSPAYDNWMKSLSILSTAAGVHNVYHGTRLGDSSKLELLVEWNSMDSYQNFSKSLEYGPYLKLIGPLLAKPPVIVIFFSKPSPATVFEVGPTLEMATLFNTAPGFLSNVEKFMEATGDAEGYCGHTFGDVSEELEENEGSGMGKAIILCIGWISKDAHMAYRETQAFKENVSLYLTNGMGGAEIHHVNFKKY